jgi:uncharacterized protein YndB with AHSA1/START domain
MSTTTQIGETSSTTQMEREIVMTRHVNARRKAVFEAFTDPSYLRQWFGRRGWTLPICEVDLRPGGTWCFVSQGPDGTNMGMRGVYHEVTPYDRLVYTESFDQHPGETLNTLVLTEDGGITTITCRVAYPSKEIRDTVLKSRMREGIAKSFDRLVFQLERVT